MLSEVLGRPIAYRDASLPGFIRRTRGSGHPWAVALVMAAIYTTTRFGLAGRVAPELPRLLGRAPHSLRRFVQDHRGCWIPPRRAGHPALAR